MADRRRHTRRHNPLTDEPYIVRIVMARKDHCRSKRLRLRCYNEAVRFEHFMWIVQPQRSLKAITESVNTDAHLMTDSSLLSWPEHRACRAQTVIHAVKE